jgi:hypothetical protein
MSRPFYETNENIQQEKAVADFASRKWDCSFSKLKKAYALDYAIIRDKKVISFAEIKCRKYSMDRLDSLGGFMISLHKWLEAKNICQISDVPFSLLIRTEDGIWWHKTQDFLNDGISIGGRFDRNDAQDVEPVVLLKSNRFKKLAHSM